LFFKPKNRALMINMYDGDIRHTDEVIKDFLADIRASGLAEDSIVILLSDHGEGFWEHGLMEHGNSLYNELLHIPLVFYAPGRVPENVIVHDVVRITDVLPTVLDLVGIPYDADDFRGRSLLPLMRNGVDSPRLAFSECPHSRIVRGRAIQSSTEKLIDSGQDGQPPEYYDLMRDSASGTSFTLAVRRKSPSWRPRWTKSPARRHKAAQATSRCRKSRPRTRSRS
jgi:hypothetical protein